MQYTAHVTSPVRLLPHQTNRLFLTDGGIETSLIFDEGIELPHFAAFDLLRRPEGRAALERYYAPYLAIAVDYLDENEYQDPEVLERLRVRATPFSLAEGEKTVVNLTVVAR